MKNKITHFVGVDEAGEKAWEAFARGCQLFLRMKNNDNLNSSCKVRKPGRLSQDFEQFLRKVYSSCKEEASD